LGDRPRGRSLIDLLGTVEHLEACSVTPVCWTIWHTVRAETVARAHRLLDEAEAKTRQLGEVAGVEMRQSDE
jgi:hypothetical protein